MTFEQARATLGKEEFDIWFERHLKYIRLRNQIIGNTIIYGFLGLCTVVAVYSLFYVTMSIIKDLCGPDAWPTGVYLSLLTLYTLRVGFRYWTQDDEDDYVSR